METKIFYLPRNAMSKLAIKMVVINVPCSFPELDEMISADVIKFRITCPKRDIPTVERVLRRYEVLD